MRNYECHNLMEIGKPEWFMDGKKHPRFSYEIGMKEKTDVRLLKNVKKTFAWIRENCGALTGTFECRHKVYHWTRLVIENGKPYLECGSHGYDFDTAMSDEETAICTRGSMQSLPYAFEGEFFFRNDRMEEFLSQWDSIKNMIIAKRKTINKIYDDNFCA